MASSRDLSATLVDSVVTLTAIGAFFVCTRLWVRFVSTKAYSWDDYFIMGSLAATLVQMSLIITMVSNGYGKSMDLLDPAQVARTLKFNNFAILVNGFAMAFLKISIALSLLRLQLGKGMVWIVWGAIFLSVACNALTLVTTLFGCRPLAAVWDRSLAPIASCMPLSVNVANSYTQTVGNIITDLFYSLSPLYYLSKVKVSVYNKWALRGVFIIGLLATVCSIAKCTELPKLQSTTDPTYDGALLSIWVCAELNAGLVAAAIPPLKALFEHILRNVFGVKSQLRSKSSGYATRDPSARRSRYPNLEDDEIAMRSHAACVHGGNESQLNQFDFDLDSADGESPELGNRHGAVSRCERRVSGDEPGEHSKLDHGPITKTMSYTVHRDESYEDERRDPVDKS